MNNSLAKKGFTLVELLVVISIIALLLSILMPSLAKVREAGLKTVCMTRLKDIGLANNLYLMDNRNKMPDSGAPGGRWIAQLAPYYNRSTAFADNMPTGQSGSARAASVSVYTNPIIRCPTQDKWRKLEIEQLRKGNVAEALTVGPGACYGYNNFFIDWSLTYPGQSKGWRKYNDILQPSGLPAFGCFDGDNPSNPSSTIPAGWWMRGNFPHPVAMKYGYNPGGVKVLTLTRYTDLQGPAPVHGGKCNYLMADWHVESQGPWKWPVESIQNAVGAVRSFHPKRKISTESGYNPS